jgi:Protein of unknown function (DUF3089)
VQRAKLTGYRPVRRAGRGLGSIGLVVLAGMTLVAALSALPAAGGAAVARATAPSNAVWLCKPGQANDPCTENLDSTAVTATGSTKVTSAKPNSSSKFDCFYVYPTVSGQITANANLQVQSTEIATAVDQASRFSQDCRVWAPMYRQRTVAGLSKAAPDANQIAFDSLLSGWEDYLAHFNHGRPVIFIGHSQGAAMLIRLLQEQIDPSPALRKLMVSAIILGGNVTVPVGKKVGGSFTHIPTCSSAHQTGCVIAYSSFGMTPPNPSLFGRPGTGVSTLSNQSAKTGLQVVCVNPVNFSQAKGPLLPYFLGDSGISDPGLRITTPWVSYPGLYTAQCQSVGGATSLQVIPTGIPGDVRPLVKASLGPVWGYHVSDVNLALGNLVTDVAAEETAYHG